MNLQSILKSNTIFLIFFTALIVYGFSAGLMLDKQSKTPQYVYLANSLLHGHTDLVTLPKSKFDLIFYNEKWYVPGGLTPAILLMPFVALFGVNVSDVFFGVVIGALNVALMYLLLGCITEKTKNKLWLTLLFAVGTVHWWVSSVGSVWFNAHLVSLLFMILFTWFSIKDKPLMAGFSLGLAFLSRPSTIFSAIFFLALVFIREKKFRLGFKKMLSFGLAVGSSIVVMFAYNYLRFGSPMEFGYGYVQGTNALTNAYTKTGGFNIQYIPCNSYVSLIGMPNIDWNPLPSVNQVCSHLKSVTHDFLKLSRVFNPMGMSIFLTTPAFLLIFRASPKKNYVIPAWLGLMATLIVLWMYHTTGYVQFGYRYVLDVLVFFFILLGQAMENVRLFEKTLIGASVMMGATGVYLMYYMTFGLIWYEMFIEMARKIYHLIF